MTENVVPEPLPEEQQPLTSSRPGSRQRAGAGNLNLSLNLGPRFPLLLALFLAFRLLTLLLLRPGGFIRDWSDFDTYLGIAAMSDYGLYPFLHYWLEWPPLIPWLAVGAYKLSLLFPPWTDHRLWFTLILGSVFVLFETGNFILLYRIARRLYEEPTPDDRPLTAASGEPEEEDGLRNTQYAIRSVVLYALLFIPVYAMLGFFDAIALFFLLLALDFILRGRLLSSAVSVGVGFLVKLTPIVFAPVALRQVWDEAQDPRAALRDSALYLVTTALTILALLLPFLLTQPAWLLTTARSIAGRSSWETVWAVLEGYFGYGVVGGDRLNPAETSFAVHASSLPWWLITLGFGLLYLFLWTRPADYRKPRNVVALSGLTLTIFLLYSKGYSPQFMVYLLPFIILLFPDVRGVTYSLLLTLLNVLEQPVYFVLLPDATWLLEAVVVTRWLVLGALLVEFGTVLWGQSLRRLAALRRYAPAGLATLAGLGLVVAMPAMGRAYAELRLSEDPAASLIGYLRTEQAQSETRVLLVTDQDFLYRVTPYLGNEYDVRLAGGDRLYTAAPSVAELTADADKVWVVATGDATGRVESDLNARGQSLLTYNFEQDVLQLFASRGRAVPLLPPARLANAANLIGYTIEQPARYEVRITLYWWAAGIPTQSYTVFTQVLDADGNLVASHDSFPANGAAPTETWVTGRVYADTHLIQLPVDLPRGSYRLVAGMYDFNLRRVAATGPDALIFRDRAVPLGEIELP
jgi:hypothetical protein